MRRAAIIPSLTGALLAAGLAGAPALAAPGDTAAVVVLAHPVERGTLLSASDLDTAELPESAARRALTREDLLGMEATRNLRAGVALHMTDISAPRLVRRGEPVMLTVSSGAMTITAAGRALGDASKGESVRVVNLATNRTLDGIASATGEVAIPVQ